MKNKEKSVTTKNKMNGFPHTNTFDYIISASISNPVSMITKNRLKAAGKIEEKKNHFY